MNFKLLTICALGLVAVSANFLVNERALQITNSAGTNVSISTTCVRSTTAETSTTSGFCCGTYTKNLTVSVGSTQFPAEFSGQSFINVGTPATNYTFTCNLAATATNANSVAATGALCNSTVPCANLTATCCGVRSWSFGGISASSTTKSSCVSTQGILAWATYSGASNLTGMASVQSVCSVTTTFGAYIKASLMVFVAVVSVMLV